MTLELDVFLTFFCLKSPKSDTDRIVLEDLWTVNNLIVLPLDQII